MLLAIDVGNTQTVYGLWDGSRWLATWRRSTQSDETEDQLAGWLKLMFDLSKIPCSVDQIVVGSVVPPLDPVLETLAEKWFGCEALFLRTGDQVGLEVNYDPPHAVGADRIANCIGALDRYRGPLIVVDFGTATTFDIVDASGAYAGGAIMTGVQVSAQALASRTAKLPRIELRPPSRAIGKNTVEALQSGIMIGYAGAVDSLIERISGELTGTPTVLATGGLAEIFCGLCKSMQTFDPHLTLDGLRLAAEKLAIA